MMNRCPYPGLRPFEPEEAQLFFGRDEQIEQLLDKLAVIRFISVVGLSGCGKSSLVNAGMIPALESGLLPNASFRWQIARMRPGSQPLRNLAEALQPILKPDSDNSQDSVQAEPVEALPFIEASLRRGPLSLLEILREAPLPKHTNLLIVVDQFEELFRFHHEGGKDETEAFVKLLLASVQQDEMPIYVVTTMRSEFIGQCALFYELPEKMNEGQFLTPRLTRDQQREAIEEPAELFNGTIEPRLVNTLLNEMGADPDQLPVLQHCLMRMWTRKTIHNSQLTIDNSQLNSPLEEDQAGVFLTTEDYEAIGGLQDALSRHADEAYNDLNDQQKQIAETMFRCLSEGDRRRPVALREVANVAQTSTREVEEVTKAFRRPDRCFLRPYGDESLQTDTILDISHESLIRQWQRLTEWVKKEVESAETYRHLEKTACLWKEGKAGLWGNPDLEVSLKWQNQEKPTYEWAKRYGQHFKITIDFLNESAHEQERKNRQYEIETRKKLMQKRLVGISIIVTIIVIGLAWWAFQERAISEQAREEAIKAREEIEIISQRNQAFITQFIETIKNSLNEKGFIPQGYDESQSLSSTQKTSDVRQIKPLFQIAAIGDIKLQQRNDYFYLDIVTSLVSYGARTWRLTEFEFTLFLGINEMKGVSIGTDNTPEDIDLTPGVNQVPFHFNLGNDLSQIQQKFVHILSTIIKQQALSVITIEGVFDLGVKSEKGWTYGEEMEIEWPVQITPKYFEQLLKTHKSLIAELKEEFSSPTEKRDISDLQNTPSLVLLSKIIRSTFPEKDLTTTCEQSDDRCFFLQDGHGIDVIDNWIMKIKTIDMHDENDQSYMDVVVEMSNQNLVDLKLQNMKVTVYFTTGSDDEGTWKNLKEESQTIEIGTAAIENKILEAQKNSEVTFHLNMGNKQEQFEKVLFIMKKLGNPSKPIHMFINKKFDLGLGLDSKWLIAREIRVEWIFSPKVGSK